MGAVRNSTEPCGVLGFTFAKTMTARPGADADPYRADRQHPAHDSGPRHLAVQRRGLAVARDRLRQDPGASDGDGLSDRGARPVTRDGEEFRVALENAQSILRSELDRGRAALGQADLETAAEEIRKRSEWLRSPCEHRCAVITTDEEGVSHPQPGRRNADRLATSRSAGTAARAGVRDRQRGKSPTGDEPGLRSLQDGRIASLANHTPLIARDGSEHAIDDSAAPIRDENGTILGGAHLPGRD